MEREKGVITWGDEKGHMSSELKVQWGGKRLFHTEPAVPLPATGPPQAAGLPTNPSPEG